LRGPRWSPPDWILESNILIAGTPALLAALAVALTRARDQDFAEESERDRPGKFNCRHAD